MSFLFVDENGANINLDSNRVIVKYKNDMVKSLPIENLEAIYLFSSVQITSQCVIECLKKGINISYFSKNGAYFGRTQSTGHINVKRQRKQAALYNSDFALNLGKNIIKGKLNNQIVVLRRYARRSNQEIDEQIKGIKISYRKIETCKTIQELIGYEGNAARLYFNALALLVDKQFYFKGRSRRPPKDEFNAMLSLGYSILMNEIYSKIENKGLNPYFGFIHRDNEKHPTLVSDMIEEWRAVIVDSLVMSLANGHEIFKENFTQNEELNGYYLNKDGLKIFLNKYDNKMNTMVKYLDYVEYRTSFRKSIDLQINQLVKAIENEDASIYEAVYLR